MLIQAIEETDRLGEVIPLADRAQASRTALRESPGLPTAATLPLSRQSEAFLVRRAERLLERLRARSPAVVQVLTLAGGLSWVGRAILLIAFMLGVSLSALDGSRRINILAFPLIGLIAWNLCVYLILLLGWMRSRHSLVRVSPASTYERWISARIEGLLRRSTRFNVPLTSGLRRFAGDWRSIAQPVLVLRGKRLFHLGAAVLAIGLIAGMYVRGIALRYEAGWESTFLGPRSVQVLITALYGPAAALSTIPLPSSEQISRLRWTAVGGGGDAAPWIHLIALTAVLYIVLPRLLAVLVANFGIWRRSRRSPLPASLLGYARALVLSVGDGTVREVVRVTPYAYELRPDSLAGLERLLAATCGVSLSLDLLEPIRYGEEDGIASRLAGATAGVRTFVADSGRTILSREPVAGNASTADWNVIVMSLAATPEVENHGVLIAAVRDWLAQHASATPLLVVIDEAAYAARMKGDAAFQARLPERRTLWREFVAGYGLRACVADLTQIASGGASEIEARDAARAALWTASERA